MKNKMKTLLPITNEEMDELTIHIQAHQCTTKPLLKITKNNSMIYLAIPKLNNYIMTSTNIIVNVISQK